MVNAKDNIILSKTIKFAISVIEFSELLETNKKYVIAKQLIRSGTSIGANIHEAQNAESKADFIHKFKIAAKEIEETFYWLTLVQESKSYPDCSYLIEMLIEVKKIVSKIIITSKQK